MNEAVGKIKAKLAEEQQQIQDALDELNECIRSGGRPEEAYTGFEQISMRREALRCLCLQEEKLQKQLVNAVTLG